MIKAHFLPIPSQTKDTYNLSEQPLVTSVRLLQSENNFYVVVKLYSKYSFRSTCYVFGKKGIQIRDLRDSLRRVHSFLNYFPRKSLTFNLFETASGFTSLESVDS